MVIRKHDAVLSASPIFLFLLLLNLRLSLAESDVQALLKFKASLKNTAALASWNASTAPCRGWKGVVCDGGLVWGLQLEDMDLQGVIDVEALAKLPDLRSVSFMNNGLEGSLPNFTRLGALKTMYLSDNKFSGQIPETAFQGMMSLKKLHLADNRLSGPIPATFATMPKLIELTLQDNEFEGKLPDFQQKELKIFNASNNKLDGPIPASLSHMHPSSLYGNKALCGPPLQQCRTRDYSRRLLSTIITVVVAILVGAAVVALLAVCIFFFIYQKKRSTPQVEARGATAPAALDVNQMEQGVSASASGSGRDHRASKRGVRLTFLKDQGSKKFNMQELLRASAEVLGSGALGTSYKAGLNGKMMVVKRFKHMNKVSKQEFNEHMRRLGRMSHPNVHPVLAFHHRKEEKLLVADFAANLSLAARLHGNRTRSLDWPTRLKIVKGTARGLLYLRKQLPSLTPAHGHLKASNVLLDASFKPLLSDYGLLPIVNKEQAQKSMIAYSSPEFKNGGKLDKKTDIWSFGMLILEILTRRSRGLKQQGEVDLVTWVQSAMGDESSGSAAVFDQEMAGSNHGQGEMMKLLSIALSCCQADVDRRPDIKEVVDKVEEIKERDFYDDFQSSNAGESDLRSSRGLPADFKSIN